MFLIWRSAKMLQRCFKVPSSPKTLFAVCLALGLLYIILVPSFMPSVKVAIHRKAIKNADVIGRNSYIDHFWRSLLKYSETPKITCATTPFWSSRLLNPYGKSDLSKWHFRVSVPCSPFTIKFNNTVKREKVEFSCEGDATRMFTSQTMSSSDVKTVPFGDLCLLRVINTCCKDDDVVPNVLHYVWYGKKEMGYFQFLSFMSGVRFMRPCLILLHGEHLPFGSYWDYFIQLSPNVVHVKRPRIEVVYGHRLSFPEHGADVMRIEAIHSSPPKFASPTITVNVPENLIVGGSVTTVNAYDPDGDIITITMTTINPPDAEDLFYVAVSGEITITSALDYESQTQYVMVVKAKANGEMAEQTVNIFIENVNEAPKFASGLMGITAYDGATGGNVVTTLQAIDPDRTTDILYAITDGNEAGDFAVNQNSGTVSVSYGSVLNKTITSAYVLIIEAADIGQPPRTGTTTLVIGVCDASSTLLLNDVIMLLTLVLAISCCI